MKADRAKARSILARYRTDPAKWVRDIPGEDPWPKSIEIMEAVRDNRETSCKSAHSVAKSWTAARLACWMYSCWRAKVITTAPTDRQVGSILWGEIHTCFNKAKARKFPIGGELLIQELKKSPTHWIKGFTARHNNSDGFQGFHPVEGGKLLIIVDEACGVSQIIMDAVKTCLSSGDAHALYIGNPTNPDSAFAEKFKDPKVKKISISAFDTPNFTEFGITEQDIADRTWREKIGDAKLPKPYLIKPDWVEDVYAPGTPYYDSRVLAKFPVESENSLIPLWQVERAMSRDKFDNGLGQFGLDIARFGSDSSVLYGRQGFNARLFTSWSKASTVQSAFNAREHLEVEGWGMNIDTIGVGGGVYDILEPEGWPVYEAIASASPKNKDKFNQARDEWGWRLRELFESDSIYLDPIDQAIIPQLTGVRWKPLLSGKIKIESKDEMKKRGLKSPDSFDALSMCFADLGAERGFIL